MRIYEYTYANDLNVSYSNTKVVHSTSNKWILSGSKVQALTKTLQFYQVLARGLIKHTVPTEFESLVYHHNIHIICQFIEPHLWQYGTMQIQFMLKVAKLLKFGHQTTQSRIALVLPTNQHPNLGPHHLPWK